MGDYAEMAISDGIDTWRGGNGAGWGEPANLFKKQIACRRCGCDTLFWAQSDGKWKPHHFVRARNKFVLHRCGLRSDGNPSEKWPYSPLPNHPREGV